MGASGSKQASSAVRKFPTRAPGSAPPPSHTARPSRAAPAPPPASQTTLKSEQAAQSSPASSPSSSSSSPPSPPSPFPEEQDAPISADFASRLHKMGIAQPNTIYSRSSIANIRPSANVDIIMKPSDFAAPQFPAASNNATLGALEARRQLELRAQKELDMMGKPGYQGREFLDIATIRNILVMRQRGDSPSSIETRLRLKPGVVARLGRPGVVEPAT